MKYIVLFISLLFFSTSFSQKNTFEKPNYKKIKRNINKKRSNFNYTTLYNKYYTLKSKMSLEEKRHLYFGYIFQKEYNPFGISKYKDNLNKLARQKITKSNIYTLLKLTEQILRKNPFDLEVLKYRSYLHKKDNNQLGLAQTKKQIKIIKDAILSTGNGLSRKTAYHVIFREHKTEMLKFKKLKFSGVKNTVEKFKIEYLSVAKNPQNINGLFFNVSAFKMDLKNRR